MNLLRMSSDLRDARSACRRARLSAIPFARCLHVSIAALHRHATSKQRRGDRASCHSPGQSMDSFMSPCPSSGVKPRARSKPRRYPSASGLTQGVSDPDRRALRGCAAAAMHEIAVAPGAP
jgi:hypothetical protein